MSSTEIWRWSAVETAEAIRAGRATSEAVVGAHIARLHAANPALNAVVVDLTGPALEAARAADRAQAAGAALGALHGVPVTVKINVDVEGQANSNGVPGLSHVIAPGDAPVVANLKGAGGIILGLTNTPEFSLRGFTDNPLHGQTLNPWDPTITCGGSSGGAGASVAAGIGAIAHGNDIGGSLRWPAFCCGVSTIKPTLGRVPAFNPSAAAERPPMAQLMSVQGPICREVADVRLALEVMSRRDVRDPWWVPAPLHGPAVPRRAAKAKIPADMVCDPEVLARLDAAAGYLADAGYEVAEVDVPDITATFKLWVDLISTEIDTVQAEQMRALGSPPFIGALEGILHIADILDAAGYMRAVAFRARLLREWLLFLETWPVVLAPVSVKPTPAFDADLRGDAAVRTLFENDLRFNAAISVLGLPVATTPIGFAAGAPVGCQLIGSRYREDVCLDAAAAIEARVGILAHQLWDR
ncbi:amidase [Phenylobacterium sp.]|uniref:amidase n=1 Tax=Phenylobacterium sp. TaxID=1871053 RepID=UPI0025D4652C|nr:amidase [Phenylobacterium sp.]